MSERMRDCRQCVFGHRCVMDGGCDDYYPAGGTAEDEWLEEVVQDTYEQYRKGYDAASIEFLSSM